MDEMVIIIDSKKEIKNSNHLTKQETNEINTIIKNDAAIKTENLLSLH